LAKGNSCHHDFHGKNKKVEWGVAKKKTASSTAGVTYFPHAQFNVQLG